MNECCALREHFVVWWAPKTCLKQAVTTKNTIHLPILKSQKPFFTSVKFSSSSACKVWRNIWIITFKLATWQLITTSTVNFFQVSSLQGHFFKSLLEKLRKKPFHTHKKLISLYLWSAKMANTAHCALQVGVKVCIRDAGFFTSNYGIRV